MDDKGGDNGYGAWGRVPVWDGSPLTWRSFKREMQWWLSSLDAESTKKYNLAARWLLRQSGTVRQRGEEFSPDELQYQKGESYIDPETGEAVEITAEDPFAGIHRLMDALEQMNGQSTLDKRGELRAQFYLHMCRKAGERVADYSSRFRTSIADLRAEGVKLPDAELGWFYKEKLGLDPLRKQLLETALGGSEAYATIESEALRLFRDLHSQDVHCAFVLFGSLLLLDGQRCPFDPTIVDFLYGVFGGTAAVEDVVDDSFEALAEDPVVDDAELDGEDRTLEEVLQTEVEQLAEEIAEAEAEGVTLVMENGIEASAEALVSMREARVKLAEAKKKDGKHVCFDCGLPGHWAGDDGCTKPGQGLGRAKGKGAPARQGRAGEAVSEHEVVQTEAGDVVPRDVLMISAEPGRALQQAFEMSVARAEVNVAAAPGPLAADKAVVGALDSACNRTCAGEAWIEEYISLLRDAPAEVQELIQKTPETERFKFGNGGILPSCVRYRLPMMVADEMVLVWVSSVPVATLGLLLGRDFLDAVAGVLDFAERTLLCRAFNSKRAAVKQLSAGHLALPLIPEVWPDLCSPRWRKLGPDNVIETRLDCKAWARQLMKTPSRAAASSVSGGDSHSHNMTEASLALGRRVFEYNSVLLTLAQKMCVETPVVKAPAASSVTVRSKDGGGRRGTSTLF
ncbi:agaA, partial [Symbiodinium necroappetens]